MVRAGKIAPELPPAADGPSAGNRTARALREPGLLAAREAIRARALAGGFDSVGFTQPEAVLAAGDRFREFLALGRHGQMEWMAAKADRRCDPAVLWPDARAVIVLGVNYGPTADPLAMLARPERGSVSCYARNRDYHDLVKGRLKMLAGWVASQFGAQVKVFVDTAPVLEKPLAQAGGLGWQGKHTNLVSRTHGSWLFLGSVFTDLELPPDVAETDHCGQCHACLDACPTKAFPAPYQLDARRCISYLTIEHKGPIPQEFRAAIGNRIYGCDDCLAACPWNKFAVASHEMAFLPRVELTAPLLAHLVGLDDAAFRAVFSGSPIKRVGRDRFIRNVLIAIGNSAAPELIPDARARLCDAAPVVRGAAVWALAQLTTPEVFAALRAGHLPAESDPDVRAEWLGAAPEVLDAPSLAAPALA